MNPMGGAETVCINIAYSLKELGYHVTLLTFCKPKHLTDSVYDEIYYFTPFEVSSGTTLLSSIMEFYAALKFANDSLIVNTAPFCNLMLIGDINYIHFPYFLSETIYNNKLGRRVYGYLAYALSQILNHIMRFKNSGGLPHKIFLFNSKFTYLVTKKLTEFSDTNLDISLGYNAFILYPPVNVKKYLDFTLKPFNDRKDQVVTISRIAPDKQLDLVVKIAQEVREKVNFVIAGRLQSMKYFTKLKKMIKDNNLCDTIHIYPNISESDKVNLLLNSKIYLHTKIMEHFGITIVEAMSLGAIPIAHNSGGVKEILPRPFLYHTPEEAAALIENLLDNPKPSAHIQHMLRNTALKYDSEEFKRKLKKMICNLNQKFKK